MTQTPGIVKYSLVEEKMHESLKNPNIFLSPQRDEESIRKHSADLDLLLGFDVGAIEKAIYEKAKSLTPSGNVQTLGHSFHQGNQTWIGLDYQTLQTPYDEIHSMLGLIRPPSHVVDLGAGYGRMGVVLAQLHPEASFTGFEYVEERVREGRRVFQKLGLPQAQLIQQDLMAEDFVLPPADVFFLYDFGKVAHIRYTLSQLKDLADNKSFQVIARGKGCRSLIDLEHPWLSQVFAPHHEENFSVYSMC